MPSDAISPSDPVYEKKIEKFSIFSITSRKKPEKRQSRPGRKKIEIFFDFFRRQKGIFGAPGRSVLSYRVKSAICTSDWPR